MLLCAVGALGIVRTGNGARREKIRNAPTAHHTTAQANGLGLWMGLHPGLKGRDSRLNPGRNVAHGWHQPLRFE